METQEFTDELWDLFQKSTKDKAFTDHLVATDPNYMRFNFWFRTTANNIELAKLYKDWLNERQ